MPPENRNATSLKPFILLDGGTGRELMRMGAPFRQPEWSALALMEAPEFVSRVHRRYIESGADVITTNSYAVVPFHVGADRFAKQGAPLAALAGRLAREAADEASHRVRVAGSLPPVCGSYRPDLFDAAVARPVLACLRASLEPFVDIWLSETVGSIAETVLMAEVLSPGNKPWWVSYTLEDENVVPGTSRLRSGEPVGEVVARTASLGASAVLFNCCQPEVIGSALMEARRTLVEANGGSGDHVLLGAYANAFGPQTHEAAANAELSSLRRDLGPDEYLRWVRQWLEGGAGIVGGCCGVGPEHIAAIRDALERG
jgi:S-methylmethionine-dependent homocysteine/selenocysteine methylase